MDDSTSSTALGLGAGAWFASKVLGPSAEALGENLRAFLATRASSIFAKADEISKAKAIDAQPIAPGLLTRMVIDASFSENDPDITEWWANLFVDAAGHGSNKHAVFSDIMALLGPSEVRCLDEFVNFRGTIPRTDLGRGPPQLIGESDAAFEHLMDACINVEDPPSHYPEVISRMLSARATWPMHATEWKLPAALEGGASELRYGADKWSKDRSLEFSILERGGIIKPVSATFSVWGGTVWVKGLSLTTLGFEFYAACKGLPREPGPKLD